MTTTTIDTSIITELHCPHPECAIVGTVGTLRHVNAGNPRTWHATSIHHAAPPRHFLGAYAAAYWSLRLHDDRTHHLAAWHYPTLTRTAQAAHDASEAARPAPSPRPQLPAIPTCIECGLDIVDDAEGCPATAYPCDRYDLPHPPTGGCAFCGGTGVQLLPHEPDHTPVTTVGDARQDGDPT